MRKPQSKSNNVLMRLEETDARVTVITPTYNRARLIERTIRSVLAQDYTDYVYIVLDDGSQDDTRDIVEKLFEGRDNCFYIYHDNIGEANTVNKGWNICRSEYFVQVNSDDTIEPTLFSEMVKALDQRSDCIVAYPDFKIVNERGTVLEDIKNTDWDFLSALSNFSCYAAAPGAFFRKLALKDVTVLKDSRFMHTNDIKMLWNIALRGNFLHIPICLASWTSHEAGISANRYKAIDEIKVWIEEYFTQKLPSEVRKVEPACRQSIERYFMELMDASGLNDVENYFKQKEEVLESKYANLQIGDNDLIGNKFNGHDLHINLRRMGIDSTHLVWNKESSDKNTYVIAGDKKDRTVIRACNEFIQQKYDLDNVHNPLMYDILYNQLFLEADVIHLHLMHNGLWDLNLLPTMSRLKPIVWTVHDMWIATGDPSAREHPDYYFPLFYAANEDFNWSLKKEAIKNSKITFVVASRYMKKALESHSAFQDKKIEYIPFGLNFETFYARDNSITRDELGLGCDEKLILFRGEVRTKKGLDYIEYVMQELGVKHNIRFLIVGNNEVSIPQGVKSTSFGWVKDDELMAKLYSVADLFLMPSTREYFGMMAIEAMACGTLPIVLDGTALPETVDAPRCGVSTPQNMEVFCKTVERYLNTSKEKNKRTTEGMAYVRKKHDMKKYLSALDKLYNREVSEHVLSDDDYAVLNSLKRDNLIRPSLTAKALEPTTSDMIKVVAAPLQYNVLVLEKEIDELKAQNDELQSEIAAICESKRWRYTGMVAKFKNKLLNLHNKSGKN